MRGWICGQFFPENSLLKTNNFEVKYGQLYPGDVEPEHYHPQGEELFIIIKGKVKIVIDGEEYIFKKGDFVFEKAKTHEAIAEVLEPTIFIAVRTPSIPDNKVFVENKD